MVLHTVNPSGMEILAYNTSLQTYEDSREADYFDRDCHFQGIQFPPALPDQTQFGLKLLVRLKMR